MNTLSIKSLRIDAWTDGKNFDGSPHDMFALHIDRGDDAPGLRRMWFLLSAKELRDLVAGKQSEFADGYHRMSVCGEEVTFYNLEFPREDAGAMQVKYMRLEIPCPLWRYFARIARFVWSEQGKAIAAGADDYARPHRIELPVDLETLARFQRRYGHGRGEVEMNLTDRLRAEMAKRPALRERVEYVTRIARGTTRSIYRRARLDVSNDGDGYYWRAVDPRGRRVMDGGIVNHAKDPGADDWSIHT